MSFKGHDLIGSKIMISNKIIKQINIFSYFRCSSSYENESDIDSKDSKDIDF
jgi:hypothetical protein